jgi:hypothetical protein
MKKQLIILFLLISSFGSAQKSTSHYKKVYNYDEYKKDWALVKTITNTYGFIDRKGNEVVQAIYSKIYEFEIQKDGKKYAMFKNIAGAFGFIDENGKEIIDGVFWRKDDAIQKINSFVASK